MERSHSEGLPQIKIELDIADDAECLCHDWEGKTQFADGTVNSDVIQSFGHEDLPPLAETVLPGTEQNAQGEFKLEMANTNEAEISLEAQDEVTLRSKTAAEIVTVCTESVRDETERGDDQLYPKQHASVGKRKRKNSLEIKRTTCQETSK